MISRRNNVMKKQTNQKNNESNDDTKIIFSFVLGFCLVFDVVETHQIYYI